MKTPPKARGSHGPDRRNAGSDSPLLFVAMPYGVRQEPNGKRRVDFDAVYKRCIAPAARLKNVDVIRADEEIHGGLIHKPMYERLLMSEIVIADLTFANPNVFYELGVRHATRPRSTILTFAKLGVALPFDVAPIRAMPYTVKANGQMNKEEVERVREELAARVEDALEDDAADSPLFQLLQNYPGVRLPHDATDTFRARAVRTSKLTLEINDAASHPVPDAVDELLALEQQVWELRLPEEQLLVSVLLAYRDVRAWSDMVRLAKSMPEPLASATIVRQQLALALNRRNESGDRNEAIRIIEGVIETVGASAESLGILGRCYKSRWLDKLERGDPGARASLDDAVAAYTKGFDDDPRDFYPGINLLTLLVCRNARGDRKRVDALIPVVEFATSRMGGLGSSEYWPLATSLELAAIRDDERLGRRALSKMRDTSPRPWMCETTADNLAVLLKPLRARGHVVDWLEDVIAALRASK